MKNLRKTLLVLGVGCVLAALITAQLHWIGIGAILFGIRWIID